MQEYLEVLNEAQRSAVIETEGPSLVIAGAGSGKTRVLTYRVAHLLQQSVKPYRVLALTFTNKAAKEMKERISMVVGHPIAQSLWMGTFHSIFARILRYESKHLGYPSSFTIYDTQDSKNLIKSIVKKMKLNDKAYKPGGVLSRISAAKNDLVTPVMYARDVNRTVHDKASQMPMIYEIYAQYMKECYKSGVMDFDDLLLNTNILFRDFPDILKKYQEQFDYILVDEYQDTNYSQYLIIKKLAEKHHNICVVGDDAQSIYSFRGAKIENILNFRNDYPGYKLFKLEQNYRSSQNIVNAANSIIAKNKGQIQKNVFSANDKGNPVRVLKAYSDIEEGFLITNDIFEKRMKNHYDFKDFAILYRTNAQSRVFEEAMRKKNMPYKIYGGLSFYQRKEIKDLLAYFRLTINPADQEALKRVINYPARGIGKTTMDKLTAFAEATESNIWNVIINPSTQTGLNAGTNKKLSNFAAMIAGFTAQLNQLSAYELAAEIASSSGVMRDLHNDKSIEGQGRIDNIEELLNGIKEFVETKQEEGENVGLVNFLEDVALLTDQDNEKTDDINKITLMTIHSAKGLEFKNVYIVGVEEGLFPALQSTDNIKSLEEERRLFYVAVTRAEINATISFARSRYKYGELTFSKPSRFIGDIDQSYLEVNADDILVNPKSSQPVQKRSFGTMQPAQSKSGIKMNYTSTQGQPKVKLNFNAASPDQIQVGVKVEHERFGIGEVINIEGVDTNKKATVLFQNAGQKQLLLKFAKLKILP